MKKIAIIGNAGSGKSSLAVELHRKLGIPLYHLDQYFWKPNWQEPDRSEFEKIHNSLCDQESWIIEGMAIRFAEYRLSRADIIIFLDVPRYICFYRMFCRAYNHFGSVYFSSAKECPERGPSLKFLHYMWQFKHKQRKAILALLEQYAKQNDGKQIFIIKSDADKKALLARIGIN